MGETYTLMEVCGTHTVNIFRFGLRSLLPPEVRLLSGPGCPVCVMPQEEIDALIELVEVHRVILCVFGDLLKVPGTRSSLREARARGGEVRVVYSPLDAVRVAEENPDRRVVLAGVGFETTAPAHAVALIEARKRRLGNFRFFPALRLMPPALRALLSDPDLRVHGLILPGHVSTVIGSKPYEFIPRQFGIPGVITGFEPRDILEGIALLVRILREGLPRIEIQYTRAVRPEGNPWGRRMMSEVFRPVSGRWRGLGEIPESKLVPSGEFEEYDAVREFGLSLTPSPEPAGCRCGEVLKGKVLPPDCPLFVRVCTPDTPHGPCMVSNEGSCAAYFRFGHEK
ncbi:hydrogenase formation protein HypD [Thermosulfurimonas sp. F29]|uniref:hydrogenase formation protein HypD n=1 Tax=Thermosulfurimonas sp. F29 TaxID=2867247 RepID=UPI001C83C107|nr:hydrogenase formation protein HypD [Thermosulfurimonas sp. F29]MBX6423742.1 hydrogenase formation protein HypD [Thermosulfurimonas sp. F29]